MNKSLKIFILLLGVIILYSFIISFNLQAITVDGTPANTTITNKVYCIGDNLISRSNINTNIKVATNAGGEFTYVDEDKIGLRGETNKFLLKLRNWGNSIDTYKLIIKSTNYSLSPATSNWKSGFIVNNIITNTITITNTKTNSFYFYIISTNTAAFGSWAEFEISAKSLNSTNSSVNTTIYTGDNQYIYGGSTNAGIGINESTFIDIVSNATTNIKNNNFIRLTILNSSIHYVSAITNQNNSGAANPPYSTPSTAASNIQDAVDVCNEGTNTVIIIDNFKQYKKVLIENKTNLILKSSNSFSPEIRADSSDNYGIEVNYSSNISIKNITVKKFLRLSYSSGIILRNNSSDIKINNVKTISNSRGLYIRDVNNINVSNSIINKNTNTALYIYSGSKNCYFNTSSISSNSGSLTIYIRYATNIFIQNNNIISNTGMGICIASISTNISIYNNNILKNNNYGIGSYSGVKNNIKVYDNIIKYNNTGIYFYELNNSFIKNNIITSNYNYGIYGRSNRNLNIISNSLKYNDNNGIYLIRNNNNISIFSNLLYYNGTNGICIEDNPTNIKIKYNKIIGHTPYPRCGVKIDDYSKNILLQYNYMENNSHHIRIAGGSDITIFKNLFFKGSRALNIYTSPVDIKFINNSCISNIQGIKPNENTTLRNIILYGNRDYSLTTDSSAWTINIYNSYIGNGISGTTAGTFNFFNCITNTAPEFKSLNKNSNDFGYLNWNSPLQIIGYNNPNKPCLGRYPDALFIYNNSPNINTSHYIYFTTSLSNNTLPSNGLIKIEYLKDGSLTSDFDFSNVTNAAATNGFSGSGAAFSILSTSANGYTLQTTSGTPNIPGQTEIIKITSVKNPITSYSNYQIRITLMSNNGSIIDGPFTSNFFIIHPSGISITKSISNITLAGNPSTAIPGATMEYKITYTSTNKGSPSDVIIFDKIKNTYLFKTNSYIPPDWIFEISTNTNPNNSFNSPDYIENYTGDKNKIQFIRWKKSNVKYNEQGMFMYKVIIK